MLWFNPLILLHPSLSILFQYILCCGSTRLAHKCPACLHIFQYILCCGSTTDRVPSSSGAFLFQYILCCGSTLRVLTGSASGSYFNTSYVVVQHSFIISIKYGVMISIHLMLWFNVALVFRSLVNCIISIHLMLWFNIMKT